MCYTNRIMFNLIRILLILRFVCSPYRLKLHMYNPPLTPCHRYRGQFFYLIMHKTNFRLSLTDLRAHLFFLHGIFVWWKSKNISYARLPLHHRYCLHDIYVRHGLKRIGNYFMDAIYGGIVVAKKAKRGGI